MVASLAISYIEVNAGDASLRGGEADERGIVDTGFIATQSLHTWLAHHRHYNDIFALLWCSKVSVLYVLRCNKPSERGEGEVR